MTPWLKLTKLLLTGYIRTHDHPRSPRHRAPPGRSLQPSRPQRLPLNTASGLNAYALTDRGTWLSFKNKGELQILVEGDPQLFNQLAPDKLIGWPRALDAEEKAFIAPPYSNLPVLGRLTGRDNTHTVIDEEA